MLLRRAACGAVGLGAFLGGVQRAARCRQAGGEAEPNSIAGATPEGTPIVQRTLVNGSTSVKLLDWGATISSIRTADQYGRPGEITLGFDEAAPYVDGRSPYFGCVAGRVANRTAGGRFALDGKEYSLEVNNGPNHLHGGLRGFDKQLWHCEAQTADSVVYALLSPDGSEGYPGTLVARVAYSLPTPTSLRIEYSATADAPTNVNLTNHAYFNLRDGGRHSDVLGHQVEIAADFYLPVDETSIPTGEVRPLHASPAMDLRARRAIGEQIAAADNGMGYDHNYVLRSPLGSDSLRPVARVWEPCSGRWISVRTDQPGVQFYTGNYLDGSVGRGEALYKRHAGFCLETQGFPDAANQAHFPSITLRPGQRYTHTTTIEFGASPTPPTEPFI